MARHDRRAVRRVRRQCRCRPVPRRDAVDRASRRRARRDGGHHRRRCIRAGSRPRPPGSTDLVRARARRLWEPAPGGRSAGQRPRRHGSAPRLLVGRSRAGGRRAASRAARCPDDRVIRAQRDDDCGGLARAWSLGRRSRRGRRRTVVLVGGDTTAAVLGTSPMRVGGTLAPGVAWGAMPDGVHLVTKPGGFGGASTLVDLFEVGRT